MLAWLLINAAKRKKSLVRVGEPGIRVRKDYTLYIGICRGILLSVEQPSTLVGAFELVA